MASACNTDSTEVKKAHFDGRSGSDGETQKQTAAQQDRAGPVSMEKQGQDLKEDQFKEEHLRQIEAMFREADTDCGGSLDMDEFREAFKKIMVDVEDEDLDIIFMKVDTNCDGTVDWDEFLNYMLLEFRERDTLQKQSLTLYFPKPLKIVPVNSCKPIVRLQFYPFQSHTLQTEGLGELEKSASKSHVQSGRYLSINQDGVLNYWSERFKLTRTVKLDLIKKSRQVLIMDMVCLSNLSLLALASTGRVVEFYDISASKCDRVFSLTGLESYAVVMDYWSDGIKGVFSFGDADGCVSVFISVDVVQNGLFNIEAFKSGHIPVPALLKNTSKLYLCFKVALHSDWCQQVRFLPELKAVATCCSSDQTAMVLTTILHSHKAEVHNTAFQVRKGILCFDYSPEFNILVTGGFDRILRIWDPYITNKTKSEIKGHSAAIIYVTINSRDSRIISISKDKNVLVWDLQDCVCLQHIPSMNIVLGQLPISSIYYNKDTNTLVLATFMIGVLQGVVDDVKQLKTSHKDPLCAALYNSNFKQVVSGCHNGVVCVWDILTGEKVMQFRTSPKPVEITAMAFDGPKRRLFTGSKDGTLRMWNFNNGALLLTLPLLDDNEITSIQYINQRIYVSGWSKKVMWYLDTLVEDKMEYRVWNQYHAEDINSMHVHSNKMLATASYNGDIIIWNVGSGQAFCRFNANESSHPLIPIRADSSCLNESPQPQSKLYTPKPSSISTGELEKPRQAVQKVVFLNTRERSPDTAILLTCAADGCVHAWSVHQQGGLLGKFRAVFNKEAAIGSMSTDSKDLVLFTGDSRGYITDINGRRVVLTPPRVLSSWRGHLKTIVSVEYVERFRLLVTASTDCTVRLWTLAGSYIGTFGQTLWLVGAPEVYSSNLPADLRRAGSYQTLKVLNKGTQPHWNCGRRILDRLIELRNKRLLTTIFGKNAGFKLQGLVPIDPRIAKYTPDQINATWSNWEEKGKQKSAILGSAYKQKVRHHLPTCHPNLQDCLSTREQLRVYKSMMCSSLLPVGNPTMPELLKQQQKNQEMFDNQDKPKCDCKTSPCPQHHIDPNPNRGP
ncbi:WD repeat-containing protein on Y chromosome-like isoform X2 [Hoplias malabaricus]|uniref:WD repeat-containing protein on Y chromosome-like isoform X2 n=1 Tax=Hoplias malabaricus TaxID=27720 RepID=UPI003461A841